MSAFPFDGAGSDDRGWTTPTALRRGDAAFDGEGDGVEAVIQRWPGAGCIDAFGRGLVEVQRARAAPSAFSASAGDPHLPDAQVGAPGTRARHG
ncbi:hypothetical protein [Pseudonocardia acidicola]|uniref:Uncharacterized protein n=1 Tax=Pseudonocardia acidicola TaxID=2724939 RepID=A0ABX1SN02_9PSEU|nr:hypothetical protein [Pseudonocardia acidicola]NMI02228.1 hypothetical protein [Pseudonocardia acidicola]